MTDDMISQEEIDALLNGGLMSSSDPEPEPAPAADEEDGLSDMERDALGAVSYTHLTLPTKA